MEAAFDFVPGREADHGLAVDAELAAISGVGDASSFGEVAAGADVAGSGSAGEPLPEACRLGGIANSFGELAFGAGAHAVANSASLGLRASGLTGGSGSIGGVLALGVAAIVVLPHALILVRAAEFVLEEGAASCAVVSTVRSAREDGAHAVG